MITVTDVQEFMEKMAGEDDWLYAPADSKLKDDAPKPQPTKVVKEKTAPVVKEKEAPAPPPPSGRQRMPVKTDRLIEDKDAPIKGRKTKPTGGCWEDGQYYSPCPAKIKAKQEMARKSVPINTPTPGK